MTPEQLLSRVKEGDRRAFEDLYYVLADGLMRYGQRLCADQNFVEDALQDMFVHLWNSRSQLPVITNVRSYCMTALRRRLYRMRANNSVETPSENVEENVFDLEIISLDAVQKEVENEAMVSQIKQMIDRLSHRQKEIIYLKFFEGMDYEEVGEIMGLEYQSLRNLMNKALTNIRKMIGLLFWGIFFFT